MLSNKIKPISPKEIVKIIPDEVLIAFNELLAEDAGKVVTLKQEKVLARINEVCKRDGNNFISSRELFDKKWLDVEEIYKAAGWKVTYESPSIGDDFKAYWKFSR